MRTEDHYALAKELSDRLNISRWNKMAFLFGNIEPDYNRISYMGLHKEHFSLGHSYNCRKGQIRATMNREYTGSLLWWFRCGKAFHYLTDSFSRPHNPEFGYNSPAHVAYERKLQDSFRRALKNNPWKVPVVEGDLKTWIERRHRVYMDRTKGMQDDCYYIITTVTAVWNWMIECKMV